MKLGLVGLSLAGKTTVFNAVTGLAAPVSYSLGERRESSQGVVPVPDVRLDRIQAMFKPERRVPMTLELVDQAGFRPGAPDRSAAIDPAVRLVDALAIVVRAFDDAGVPHPLKDAGPRASLQTVADEMTLMDLDIVERRLERLGKDRARGKLEGEREEKALHRCREALQEGRPLRSVELADDEREMFRGYAFLTAKPALVVANIGEEGLTGRNEEELRALAAEFHAPLAVLAARLEIELASLEPAERETFRESYGMHESARDILIRTAYETLDIITYYTAGENEVRAWTLPRGGSALDAAGNVHTDLAKGFVRAEVIHYDEFVASGSVAAAREKGLYRLEGRDYTVKDGDMLYIRHNK